jgi:hypothetical protein
MDLDRIRGDFDEIAELSEGDSGSDRYDRTGWPVSSRKARRIWARHGRGETYLSLAEANGLADRVLPGARVVNHWLWRYTIVWDKPAD